MRESDVPEPAKNPDLHGNVPESSPVALLLIDVINDLTFEGSEPLARQALPMAKRLLTLKQRARKAGIPAIYINDNFGQWRSDFRQTVAHCTSKRSPGRRVSQPHRAARRRQ